MPRRSNKKRAKDEMYLEAVESLGKEAEKPESTYYQKEGVLYRKINLWGLGGL
jgi:hypothetical protein